MIQSSDKPILHYLLTLLRPNIKPKRILHIHEPRPPPLRNLVHGLKVLLAQLHQSSISSDAALITAFRQHRISPLHTPRYQHLGQCPAILLRYCNQIFVCGDFLAGARDLVL